MDVKVKMEFYPGAIQALEKAVEVSAEQATKAMLTDIRASGTVPKQTSALEDSGFVENQGKTKYKISFSTPYARRLYWNPQYNFRTDKNPNAQGLWMQTYVDGDKKNFFINVFRLGLKRNAKGLVK